MSVSPRQVADGGFVVETDLVNWVLLVDGSDVTLIDSGYPGQRALVEGRRSRGEGLEVAILRMSMAEKGELLSEWRCRTGEGGVEGRIVEEKREERERRNGEAPGV